MTSHGIARLGWGLSTGAAQLSGNAGPWRLRILRLQNCQSIDDSVFNSIPKFPLLCVVGQSNFYALKFHINSKTDLRGTKCTTKGNRDQFEPCHQRSLFHPAPIIEALDDLTQLTAHLFPHSRPFILHIDSLTHPQPKNGKPPKRRRTIPETFTFVPIKPTPINPHRPIYNLPPAATQGAPPHRLQCDRDLQYFLRYELETFGDEDHHAGYGEILSTLNNILEERGSLTVTDVDSHLAAIFDEEFRAEASLQALKQFYGRASDMSIKHECQYTKPPPRIRSVASSRDEMFMLMRDPPPWKEEFEPAINNHLLKSNSRDVESIASADRSSGRGRRAVDGVFDMIAKRKEIIEGRASQPSPSSSYAPQSKNPFKRTTHSFSLAAKLGTSLSTDSIETVASIRKSPGILPAQALPADSLTPARPLKRISSLTIPSLPPAAKKRKGRDSSIIEIVGRKKESKQTKLPGMFFNHSKS